MKDFQNIKNQWGMRQTIGLPENGAAEIIKKGKAINRGQIIAQLVLAITSIVLIGFFFYISAYKNSTVSFGLLLMIGSLLFRILVEFAFTFRTRKFHPGESFKDFNGKLQGYYKSRLYINYLVTPVLFVSYIIGFIVLLPSFRENLSLGFYHYVFYSSWVIFAFLAVLIFVQVRKELRLIRELKRDLKN